MTELEKREFLALYEQRMRVFEKKYEKHFNALLKQQNSHIASILKEKGFTAAKNAASHMIFDLDSLTKLLTQCHKEVGLYVAQRTDQQIHREFRIKVKTGRIGFNPRWLQSIVAHFQDQALNLTTNINQTTRDRIETVLSEAQDEGWGIEETARELESDELSRPRAKLIARTETAKAANAGREAAVATVGFQMNKEWIATLDLRTRFTHMALNGVVVDENESFDVGGYDASGPGDQTLPAEEVCNCRCAMAFLPKRNERGRLIPKTV